MFGKKAKTIAKMEDTIERQAELINDLHDMYGELRDNLNENNQYNDLNDDAKRLLGKMSGEFIQGSLEIMLMLNDLVNLRK